jgi:hypothetical protein
MLQENASLESLPSEAWNVSKADEYFAPSSQCSNRIRLKKLELSYDGLLQLTDDEDKHRPKCFRKLRIESLPSIIIGQETTPSCD